MAKKMNQKLDRQIRKDSLVSNIVGFMVFLIGVIPVISIMVIAIS